MKTIKAFSAACTIVCAFAALTATAATAHEWQIRGVGLTKSVSTGQTATYTFVNTTNDAYFTCTVEEKGTASPGAAGTITSVKEVSCNTDGNFCETAPTIEARNLPWSTELVTYEGGLGNHIKTTAAEWKWQCRSHFTGWTESCAVDPTMKVKNVSTGVDETYNANVGNSCSNSTAAFYTEGGGILKETFAEELLRAI